jgi:nicotinamidase/pyrazinamidase
MTGDRTGLLIVDVQNDFCDGGALAVAGSEGAVAALNRYLEAVVPQGMTVFVSRDWHPAITSHFKTYGGPWPVHCVQGTRGARFHPGLHVPPDAIVITKGESQESPGYSAFEGRTTEGKSFREELRARSIGHLVVGGLATDYCVKHSVLDALSSGLQVTVLEDAIAGVRPDDSAAALTEMRDKGARTELTSSALRPTTSRAGRRP